MIISLDLFIDKVKSQFTRALHFFLNRLSLVDVYHYSTLTRYFCCLKFSLPLSSTLLKLVQKFLFSRNIIHLLSFHLNIGIKSNYIFLFNSTASAQPAATASMYVFGNGKTKSPRSLLHQIFGSRQQVEPYLLFFYNELRKCTSTKTPTTSVSRVLRLLPTKCSQNFLNFVFFLFSQRKQV